MLLLLCSHCCLKQQLLHAPLLKYAHYEVTYQVHLTPSSPTPLFPILFLYIYSTCCHVTGKTRVVLTSAHCLVLSSRVYVGIAVYLFVCEYKHTIQTYFLGILGFIFKFHTNQRFAFILFFFTFLGIHQHLKTWRTKW